MTVRTRIRRPSPGTALGGLALIVAMSGVAMAAIPGGDGTATACVTSKGAITVIDAEAGKACPKATTAIKLATTDATGKVANADSLDGQDSSAFLGTAAKAADSDNLDGKDSADFLGSTDPRLRCMLEVAASGLPQPANAIYHVGTNGDEFFDGRILTPEDDVVCGFDGADVFTNAHEMSSGDMFLGGAGIDQLDTLTTGLFIGGDGDDQLEYLKGGTFNGEGGCDRVRWFDSGTFNQGEPC